MYPILFAATPFIALLLGFCAVSLFVRFQTHFSKWEKLLLFVFSYAVLFAAVTFALQRIAPAGGTDNGAFFVTIFAPLCLVAGIARYSRGPEH